MEPPGPAWTLGGGTVKKIRFRSARSTARDVFELAAVAEATSDLPDALARTPEAAELHAR